MSQRLTVLLPFPATAPKGNPFRLLLEQSLQETPDLKVLHFSWPTALGGRYDVFHQHWPEILVAGRPGPKKAIRQILYLLLLVRLRVLRIPMVRTVHNLDLPQGISRIEEALLRLTERWTTLRIRINSTTPLEPGEPQATILHGHYRDWYDTELMPGQISGRLLYFGLVRRYKNVAALVRSFRDCSDAALSLHVAGNPSSDDLSQELEQLSAGDPRITLDLRFLTDQEIVEAVGAAELVVLPYREMHNSAGVLTALSLNRPVLVPNNALNRALSDEVGSGWVFCYQDELTPGDLESTLAQIRSMPTPSTPDLSAREWRDCGRDHERAYREARRIVRGAATDDLQTHDVCEDLPR